MADDITDRARAALEGVTDGPWGTYGDGTHEVYQEPTGDDEGQYICYQVVRTADARFIAAARTLVPELRAEVERLRGALKDLIEVWRAAIPGVTGSHRLALVHHAEDIGAVLRGDQ